MRRFPRLARSRAKSITDLRGTSTLVSISRSKASARAIAAAGHEATSPHAAYISVIFTSPRPLILLALASACLRKVKEFRAGRQEAFTKKHVPDRRLHIIWPRRQTSEKRIKKIKGYNVVIVCRRDHGWKHTEVLSKPFVRRPNFQSFAFQIHLAVRKPHSSTNHSDSALNDMRDCSVRRSGLRIKIFVVPVRDHNGASAAVRIPPTGKSIKPMRGKEAMPNC